MAAKVAQGWGGGGGWSGNSGELDFVKRMWVAHVGWDFGIHDDPWGGKFDPTIDPTTILKSWEDLGMSDEWYAILENTQNSFERVSRVQKKEYCVFLKKKCWLLHPLVLCLYSSMA